MSAAMVLPSRVRCCSMRIVSRAAASDRAPLVLMLLTARSNVMSVALLSRAAASDRAPTAPMLFK